MATSCWPTAPAPGAVSKALAEGDKIVGFHKAGRFVRATMDSCVRSGHKRIDCANPTSVRLAIFFHTQAACTCRRRATIPTVTISKRRDDSHDSGIGAGYRRSVAKDSSQQPAEPASRWPRPGGRGCCAYSRDPWGQRDLHAGGDHGFILGPRRRFSTPVHSYRTRSRSSHSQNQPIQFTHTTCGSGMLPLRRARTVGPI